MVPSGTRGPEVMGATGMQEILSKCKKKNVFYSKGGQTLDLFAPGINKSLSLEIIERAMAVSNLRAMLQVALL